MSCIDILIRKEMDVNIFFVKSVDRCFVFGIAL